MLRTTRLTRTVFLFVALAILWPMTADASTPSDSGAWIQQVLDSEAKYWSQWAEDYGLSDPIVTEVTIPLGQDQGTACQTYTDGRMDIYGDATMVVYCRADDSIYLPMAAIISMFTGERFGLSGKYEGQMALGIVVAHEYGHNMEAELAAQLGVAPPGLIQSELMANCFAGLWSRAAQKRHILPDISDSTASDVLWGISNYGDPIGDAYGPDHQLFQSLRLGRDSFHPHKYALLAEGPQACLNQYWPQASTW